MKEIWKPVKDFEGLYEVSNFGQIKTLSRQCGRNFITEKILKPHTHFHRKDNKYGFYLFTSFRKNNRYYQKYIHRVVAEAFILNPENKKFVNHKDGNKGNNVVSNLEWVTSKENLAHAINNNLQNIITGAKLTEKEVIDIYHSEGFQREIGEKFNVTDATISMIKNKKIWKEVLINE